MNITRIAKFAAAVGIGLVVAGCASNGVPRGAHVVGGGLFISYHPDTPGTAILMEKTSGKVIATASLDDSTFEFNVNGVPDATLLRSVLGTNMPKNAQFVLYFAPNKKSDE